MIEHDPSMAEYTEYGRVHRSPLIFTEYTDLAPISHRFCPASALQLHTESTCPRTVYAPNSHSDRLRTDLAPISHRLEVLEVVSNHLEYALRKYRYQVEDTEY